MKIFEVVVMVAAIVAALALAGSIGTEDEGWITFWLAVMAVAVGVLFGAWSVIDRG